MRIAIIGRSEWTYLTMEKIAEAGFEIPLIVTSKSVPEYRYHAEDFESYAKKTGAVYHYNPKIDSAALKELLKETGPIDIALSVNYSGIISQDIIELFPLGILNAHGGDLPRFRGNACQVWAMITGEKRVGLCIHKMIGGELDSGPIIAKEYFDLNIDTRIADVYKWMDGIIPELMLKSVKKLQQDPGFVLEYQSTNPKDALRCYPRKPEDGKIDWRKSNVELIRLINASSEPYAGAFCELNGELCRIWRAGLFTDDEICYGIPGQITSINENGNVVVLTGEGKILVEEIEVNNKRTKPKEFIKSLRTRFS